MKRLVPLFIAIFAGWLMIVSEFIPATQSWGETVTEWFNILAAIAFILGAGNLLTIYLRKISDRSAGWGYAAVTLITFFATLVVGMLKLGVHASPTTPAHRFTGPDLQVGGGFWWIYEYAFQPLTATMFAMLAFYVASAAFRAFRAKNMEAILLLGTAFIVLLGRTFAGPFLTGWLPKELEFLKIENLTIFIMQAFNTAGSRAIMIGIALGVASVSLKILLGVDRSYIGSGDE